MTLFDRLATESIESESQINRSRFLKKVGALGVVLTGGIAALAVPKTASARNVACCVLAYDNDCPTRDHCLDCQTYYEWTCPWGGATWVCQECYQSMICGGCSLAFILRPGRAAGAPAV
jgi:hypothetical protein